MKQEIRRNWLIQGRRLLMGLLLSGLAVQTSAETQVETEESQHYISPRLQLGLHTKASLDSPIKELLSSGTAVEVVNTDKDFSQIKTTTGAEGWIKSKFLTEEVPAGLKVEKLELALQQAQEKLLQQLEKTESSNEQLESDSKNNATLAESQLIQSQTAAFEETIAQLRAELNAWEQLDLQDKQAQKEQADNTSKQLQQRLAMIAALASGNDELMANYDRVEMSALLVTENDSEQSLLKKLKKDYLLLLMVAGFGFFLGMFAMDLHNRRRHGGFRV